MTRFFIHRHGTTEQVPAIEHQWLAADSGVVVWADFADPTPEEGRLLAELFGFHELAIESALQREPHPKVESYGGYLYLVLHGINFQSEQHEFDTHDTDFFLGSNFLVTVHDGRRRSIAHIAGLCGRTGHILAEGSVALLHRIVDTMVDHYRPEVDALEDRLDEIEKTVIQGANERLMGDILGVKRDISSLRRIVVPQ
ncbi:MAG: hypothetical protein OEW19_11330, partial [Acidobacteriota bacterium]|nr:hypothetical protein [Acidobacteriota bacterium]